MSLIEQITAAIEVVDNALTGHVPEMKAELREHLSFLLRKQREAIERETNPPKYLISGPPGQVWIV